MYLTVLTRHRKINKKVFVIILGDVGVIWTWPPIVRFHTWIILYRIEHEKHPFVKKVALFYLLCCTTTVGIVWKLHSLTWKTWAKFNFCQAMVNVLHILMTSNRLLFAIFSICAVCRHVRSLIKQQKINETRVWSFWR